MCPGVNSASKKLVPGISLGVKAAGAWGWRSTTLVVPNVKKSGARTPLGHLDGLLWERPLPLPIRNILQIKITDHTQMLHQTFMKQHFIAIHTIRQTEIPALPDSWLQTHLLSKCCVHKELLLFILPWKHNMVCCGSVKFFMSFVKMCVGGLRQIAVSWAKC